MGLTGVYTGGAGFELFHPFAIAFGARTPMQEVLLVGKLVFFIPNLQSPPSLKMMDVVSLIGTMMGRTRHYRK